MSRSLVIALSCLLQLCLSGNANAERDPSVVALFGDSTTVGFNTNFDERFGDAQLNFGQPSIQLTQILNSSDRPSVVPNLGIGGSSSGPATAFTGFAGEGNGVDRISEDLSDVITNNPGRDYYVLILYGTNDPARGIPSSVTGFNNGIMVQRANALGYTALVSSILPCDVCPNNVATINNAIINEVNSRIAGGADARFVNIHDAVRADWISLYVENDGIHPNNAGYAAIAQNWFDLQLRELITPESVLDAVNSNTPNISSIISLLLLED